MVHGVAAGVERHLSRIGPIGAHGLRHLLLGARQAADARVETAEIGRQELGGVALGVDGDEDDVHLAGIGAQRIEHLGDLEQLGRADVGAMGKAEEDEARPAGKVLLGEGLAVLVGEGEGSADRRGTGGGLATAGHGEMHHRRQDAEAADEQRQ